MSSHIESESIRAQLWEKMRGNKKYRHNFVAAHLSTNIAAQIQTLRESQPNPWTQKDLAERTGMARARISVLENPSYDKHTLSTLKRIAEAFDVALVVRFVAFSELVKWVSDLSPEKLAVPSFDRDLLGSSLGSPQKGQDLSLSQRVIELGASSFPSVLGTDSRQQVNQTPQTTMAGIPA